MEELPISPANSRGSPTPGKEQQAAGVGILLQIMMLVLSFVLGHVLRRHRFYYLPEASASLLIGNALISLSSTALLFFYLQFRMDEILLFYSDFNSFLDNRILYLLFVFLLYFNLWAGLIVGGLANISNTENSIRSEKCLQLIFQGV